MNKKSNGSCVASFILGIISVFAYQIYILPILTIIFGIIGIANYREEYEKNKWMGVTGLILGILFLMEYVYWYFNY